MKKTTPTISARSLRIGTIIASFMLLSSYVGFLVGNGEIRLPFIAISSSHAIVTNKTSGTNTVDFSQFWEVWDRLEQKYVDQSKLDPQKMVYGAIAGMTASLDDPYTVFLPPKDNKSAKEVLSGEFEGIGAQLGMKDKRVIVIAPLKGMPAEAAGILAGDWILKVDDKETYTWTVQQAVDAIRGPKGTSVKLSILHEKDYAGSDGNVKPIDIEVTRSTIKVPSVEVEFKNNVAVVKLSQFGDETNNEWVVAMNKIKSQPNVKGLVLDLRNNPGGYLQGSVYIASEFLENGVVVIQQFADGREEVYTVDRQGMFTKNPMVVLVNKGSASASEIVAGALKVRGRAKVVGETTFGKGSIQDAQDLGDGAGLHITIAKWLLPDKSWINSKGVTPDIEVTDNTDTKEVDEQLDKAIETVLN